MRSPNRIPKTIALLQSLWYRYPDLRFGQVCALVQSKAAEAGKDLFQMEEHEVNQLLLNIIVEGA